MVFNELKKTFMSICESIAIVFLCRNDLINDYFELQKSKTKKMIKRGIFLSLILVLNKPF